jgi:hypothetical protein
LRNSPTSRARSMVPRSSSKSCFHTAQDLPGVVHANWWQEGEGIHRGWRAWHGCGLRKGREDDGGGVRQSSAAFHFGREGGESARGLAQSKSFDPATISVHLSDPIFLTMSFIARNRHHSSQKDRVRNIRRESFAAALAGLER